MSVEDDRAWLTAAWQELGGRGWLTAEVFETRGAELTAVREVAAQSVALGRVFDGHRNALERLLVHRRQDIPGSVVDEAASGQLALGVWGADPGPGEGPPGELRDGPNGPVVCGVKTFCSGAGLLDLAIVLVRRSPDAPPILPVLVDLRGTDVVEIDRNWFATSAMRESASDRVLFHDTPVLAVLGGEGTLSAEPWFSGDALRSTAVWAGGVDAIVERLTAASSARTLDDADAERLGRADAVRTSCDVWLEAALAAVELEHRDSERLSAGIVAAMRIELTERIRELLRIAAELTGSRGLVADRALSQTRAALDVLLLQHRLGPLAQRRGRALSNPKTRHD